MSFAQCTSLSSLALPARTADIAKGCFRDCARLAVIEIGVGTSPLRVGDHLFDNCVGSETMKETIAREVEWRKALKPHAAPAGNKRGARRENAVLQGLRPKMPNGQMDPAIISRGLEAVYDVISTDADFGVEASAEGYADACEHFSTFQDADKNVFRTVCSAIHELTGDDSEIVRLSPVYAWLTGSETEEAYEAGWYELSRSVRAKLQELLPRKSIYQVGVFSWIPAGAFRDDLENDAAKCRRAKVLASLRGAGLL